MMKHVSAPARAVALAALGLTAATLLAQGAGHPYRDARVGEWVKYRWVTKSPIRALNATFEQTRTVTANDGKTVTVRVVALYDGKPSTTTETIDLTKPYPLERAILLGPDAVGRVRVVPLRSGAEAVTIGVERLSAEWTLYELGTGRRSQTTLWTVRGFPLGGVVKYRSNSGDALSTMEVVDYGPTKGVRKPVPLAKVTAPPRW